MLHNITYSANALQNESLVKLSTTNTDCFSKLVW